MTSSAGGTGELIWLTKQDTTSLFAGIRATAGILSLLCRYLIQRGLKQRISSVPGITAKSRQDSSDKHAKFAVSESDNRAAWFRDW